LNDLDELKSLLFGAEKQTLDSIAERVEKRETRAVDVADILPEAIHTSHRRDGELVGALKEPVGECLRESFHEQPEFYGNALYPVMGPAIRKSIMHTLRTFTQQINTAMEQSLSAKGMKWRFQAWRAGIPFGEFVLQRTLLYRVEQAYLISRENGLLIGHVHHHAAKIKDSDAVSAMFTAIQDFVKESFSPDRTGRLETADMGEFTLWAVHGPHALLVCVIRGLPPKSLRTDLSAILERIHFRYGEAVRSYAGDTSTVDGVDEELRACLRFEAQQAAEPGRKKQSVATIVFLTLLAALIAVFGVVRWQQLQDFQRLEAVAYTTPGIYVGSLERNGRNIHLRGMRDPFAATINDIAAAAEIDLTRIEYDLQSFQSLEPDIVLRRAVNMLAVPSQVTVSLDGSRLTASGPVPYAWHQDALMGIAAVPGVDELQITSKEWQSVEAGLDELRGGQFLFRDGVLLTDEDSIKLQRYVESLAVIHNTVTSLGGTISVNLTGFADGSGSRELNEALAEGRAAVIKYSLAEAGIPEADIHLRYEIAMAEEIDLNLRRVDIIVTGPR